MIRFPEDRLSEVGNHLLDLYNSSKDLDDFKLKVLHEYPDDPTLSLGYWIGLMTGRLEGKTKISNRLIELAEDFWGGHRIRRRA